jgi:hypothetical protein
MLQNCEFYDFREKFYLLGFPPTTVYGKVLVWVGRGLPSSTFPPRFSLISKGGLHMNQSLSRGFLDFFVV